MINQIEHQHYDRTEISEINKTKGFTLVEVIIAASIMIVLCVGTLSVFSYVVKINRGENVRLQALSVLQKDVEYYRSLKFVPVGSSAELNGKDKTNIGTRISADGRVFNVWVTIDNDPYTPLLQTATTNPAVLEANCKFKEITIEAKPQVAETGWLANLKTEVTIQRVRTN